MHEGGAVCIRERRYSWRHGELPNNCAMVDAKVATCGPACATHVPGVPTAGMRGGMRFLVWVVILLGMAFVILWEMALNMTCAAHDAPPPSPPARRHTPSS